MDTESQNSIAKKLTGFVDWLAQKREQPATESDTLHAEIHQLKKALSNAPTRPTRIVRKREAVEPVTEQQKIMDLAG